MAKSVKFREVRPDLREDESALSKYLRDQGQKDEKKFKKRTTLKRKRIRKFREDMKKGLQIQ